MFCQLVLPLTGIQQEKLDTLKEGLISKLGEGGVRDDTFPYFFSLLACFPSPKLSVRTKASLSLVVPRCFLMLSAGGWGRLCVMLLS